MGVGPGATLGWWRRYEGWSGLGASIKTSDTAFDQVLGCGFWEYYRRNPEAGTIFNEAMRLIGKHNSLEVAQAYDWSQFPVIADIGGGIGGLLVDILDASSVVLRPPV